MTPEEGQLLTEVHTTVARIDQRCEAFDEAIKDHQRMLVGSDGNPGLLTRVTLVESKLNGFVRFQRSTVKWMRGLIGLMVVGLLVFVAAARKMMFGE